MLLVLTLPTVAEESLDASAPNAGLLQGQEEYGKSS